MTDLWLSCSGGSMFGTGAQAPKSCPLVLFKESNKYYLGNWLLTFVSISGQKAPASSFSSHFGPCLPLLFKLH